MIWVLVPVAAIIAWAFTEVAKYRAQGGASPELERLVEELGFQLDEAEAARAQLQKRVENLEAIVTSEHYELDRAAQEVLEAPTPRLMLDEDTPVESDEAEVARRVERLRGR
jgi:uncharacterized protein YlxW (UPF0749 family)